MDDDEVRAMNRRIDMGWEPSQHQWQLVAERCKAMPETRDAKMWGIRLRVFNKAMPRHGEPTTVRMHDIVANPQFFFPASIVAQDLTYGEAEALMKILES